MLNSFNSHLRFDGVQWILNYSDVSKEPNAFKDLAQRYMSYHVWVSACVHLLETEGKCALERQRDFMKMG